MKHIFYPKIKKSFFEVRYKPSVEEFSNETMLFSSDWDFARKNGGPLTQRVLDELEKEGAHLPAENRWINIDTRVHMLMKGMYPAIPGWHGDGFPRKGKYSQPNLSMFSPTVRHWTCVLSTSKNVGISRTIFNTSVVEMEVDPKNVWSSVSERMEYLPDNFHHQNDGEIYEFNQNTLHKVSPCEEPGWRFFLRLSHRETEPSNKIRRQTQVYATINGGW